MPKDINIILGVPDGETPIGVKSSSSLLEGLMAWFPGSDANDAHSNGYNLTPQNSPTHVTGNVGNAFQTDRDSGGRYWSVDNAHKLAPGAESWTTAFWIEPNGANSGYQGVLSLGTAAPYAAITGRPDLTSLRVTVSDDTDLIATTFSGIPNDVFSSVVVTIDKSDNTLRCWYDLIESPESPVDISSIGSILPVGNFIIGFHDVHLSNLKIDEVAFWNRALTVDERAEYHTGITYTDLTQ